MDPWFMPLEFAPVLIRQSHGHADAHRLPDGGILKLLRGILPLLGARTGDDADALPEKRLYWLDHGVRREVGVFVRPSEATPRPTNEEIDD